MPGSPQKTGTSVLPGSSAWARFVGRALRNRNYRLFFLGQAVSLTGTWITRVALMWLVFRLSRSAWILGLAGFAGQLPTFAFAPFAGVLIDRWDRHRALVVTQLLSLVQSALLCAVAFSGSTVVWPLLVLAAFQGVITAFDNPLRHAAVVEMVEDRADLPNAIALNSSLVNVARLVGPAIAGVLIALIGEGGCFAIDTLSYVAVLTSLIAMRLPRREPTMEHRAVWRALREGVAYAAGFSPIRAILLLLSLMAFAWAPCTVLMPLFASQVLGGSSHTLGLLMGASGFGATAGALWMATRVSAVGLLRVVSLAGVLMALGLLGMSYCHTLWFALPILAVAGAGMMVQLSAGNTLLQTLVDEDKRGRVLSLYTMSYFGAMPFGSLAGGWLGGRIGPSLALRCCAALTALGVVGFARALPGLRRVVQPLYVKLGLVVTSESS